MVFYLTVLVMFLVPAIFDLPGDVINYHNFAQQVSLDYETLINTHLYTFAVMVVFLLLELLIPLRGMIRLREYVPRSICLAPPVAVIICLIFAYALYGPLIIYAGFESVRAGQYGIVPLVLSYLAILSIPSPALALTQRRYLIFAFAIIPLAVPIVVFGGARQMLAISIFACAIVIIQRFGLKNGSMIAAVFLIVPIAEFVLEALKYVRNLPDFEARLAFLKNDLVGWSSTREFGESALRYVYYSISQGVVIDGRGEFSYFLRSLMFWLPSYFDIFSIKPIDFEYKVFSGIMGGLSGSMHPTFYGMLMADSGWLFLPWSLLIFLIMRVVENEILSDRAGRNYLYFFCFYVSVMWARGSIYSPLLLIFIVLAVKFLLSRIINQRVSFYRG